MARAGHLLFVEAGDGFVDAIAGGVHLEQELVAGGGGSHMPADYSLGCGWTPA